MTSLPQQTERTITALLGTKLGMTQVWDEDGTLHPVTVVQVGTNVVTQVRSLETDGYTGVQLGFGQIDPRKVSQPLRVRAEKSGLTPRRYNAEFRTADAQDYSVGQELTAEIFEAGKHVDVVGTTKGKDTAGAMKRHGFGGALVSHGSNRNHRKAGAIGGAATPGRVFKGQKMAGRMGNERQTTRNLTIHSVNAEKGVLLINGAVPGPKGGLVMVRTTEKGA